ncbi:hypothetical protein ACF3NA_05560 [Alkanindiges sp. WGS2144]|uniref:hypothetical protein n=1 Tax=Alkanindiges sp. WGS2144 TaxID=3366808 RepID=UPI0037522319
MPPFSPYSCLSTLRLTGLSKAIVVGLSSALLLGGCGSDGPTTRIDNPTDTQKPETPVKLTVRSAVKVKNAVVRLINVADGKEIDKKTIADGSELVFEIKASSYAGRLLLAEISGQDNTSSYFEPTLGKFAPFTGALHVTFTILNTDGSIMVSPFTEIAYQRALVRANSLDSSKSDLSALDAREVISVVTNANNEVYSAFHVNPTALVPAIDSMDNLRKFILDPSDVKKPLNSTTQYLNMFYGLGHFNLQHLENQNDPTPLLSFTRRAAQDMRDGNLDGMGLSGDGINSTVFLKNPIVSPQIVNTNPRLSSREDFQKAQEATQKNYAERLKPAILSFLENTLKSTDKPGIEYFKTVDYLSGAHDKYNENLPSVPFPRSLGAGNYKRAFGLGQIKLTKNLQTTLDNNCQEITVPANPDAGKEGSADQYAEIGCQIGVQANTNLGAYNPIENLVGAYSTVDNSCKLDIYINGKIILSKGNQSFNGKINGYVSDAIIRLTPGAEEYLLNVASSELNPPEFIQIRTEGQKIISATAGAMNSSSSNRYPKKLDQEKLVCTNFKAVFEKPNS